MGDIKYLLTGKILQVGLDGIDFSLLKKIIALSKDAIDMALPTHDPHENPMLFFL